MSIRTMPYRSPCGPDDHTIQIGPFTPEDINNTTHLFCCRSKDNDLTADQWQALGEAALEMAACLRQRGDAP